MVILQYSPAAFTAFDSVSNRTSILIRLDELIAELLMIPLCMVMLEVLMHGILK